MEPEFIVPFAISGKLSPELVVLQIDSCETPSSLVLEFGTLLKEYVLVYKVVALAFMAIGNACEQGCSQLVTLMLAVSSYVSLATSLSWFVDFGFGYMVLDKNQETT